MMGQLIPSDFETLVDMTFSASGWRRQGRTGGTEELIDLVLVRPALGRSAKSEERIAVQVKLETTQAEFESYHQGLKSAYDEVYFVYVRAKSDGAIHSDDDRITLFDAKRLAPMVLDAGLTSWLINRVR